MRIKKTSATAPIQAQVLNANSVSEVDTYSCNYINDISTEIYSTNEVKTNKVWLDGKPIYKKTYMKTGTANTAKSESITVGDDIEMFTNYEVLCVNNATPANSLMANYYLSSTDYFRVFTGNATTVNLRYYVSFTPKIYVTIYYTKTTD